MWSSIPVGGALFGALTLAALWPPQRPRPLAALASHVTFAVTELPHLYGLIVLASTAPVAVDGELTGNDWAATTVAFLTSIGLLVLLVRALRARSALEAALAGELGRNWSDEIEPAVSGDLGRSRPSLRTLLAPWPIRPRDVERVADIAYGENGEENLLDVYRHRAHPSRCPTLIHLHSGGFRWGRKNRTGRALLYHLAGRGWTCVSANYHLSRTPIEGFPQHLIDVKKAIAWVRTQGHRYGADPDVLFVSGGSAGAHLTAMAALTPNDPRFQPGFEDVDTSITGGVGLYGYYGRLAEGCDSTTPLAHLRADAPPFFVIHGENDTYTPVEGARHLAHQMRETSASPVVHASLPGGQHNFDVFRSIRFEAVVDAIEAFAAAVRARHGAGRRDRRP